MELCKIVPSSRWFGQSEFIFVSDILLKTRCNVTVGGLFREADMSFLVFAWSFIGILEHEFFICLWRRCGFYRR